MGGGAVEASVQTGGCGSDGDGGTGGAAGQQPGEFGGCGDGEPVVELAHPGAAGGGVGVGGGIGQDAAGGVLDAERDLAVGFLSADDGHGLAELVRPDPRVGDGVEAGGVAVRVDMGDEGVDDVRGTDATSARSPAEARGAGCGPGGEQVGGVL
ncbi:hypothetical protein ABZT02_45690 [Streptomyces sp. NPDC005402]|uniref:hypothetical protein n=1 Tax=Streptomyces sp. NPDC005402 TaxID=3155338 RepID=UPI0033AB562B